MKRFTLKEYTDYQYVKQNEFILNQVTTYNELLCNKIYTETLLREDSPDYLWDSYNDLTEKYNNMKCDSLDEYWNMYYTLLDKLE